MTDTLLKYLPILLDAIPEDHSFAEISNDLIPDKITMTRYVSNLANHLCREILYQGKNVLPKTTINEVWDDFLAAVRDYPIRNPSLKQDFREDEELVKKWKKTDFENHPVRPNRMFNYNLSSSRQPQPPYRKSNQPYQTPRSTFSPRQPPRSNRQNFPMTPPRQRNPKRPFPSSTPTSNKRNFQKQGPALPNRS